jgi:hypothetical protein
MSVKKSDLTIYMVYAVINAAIYGVFSFFVIYRGLAGGVMLYSYLWNIAAIIVLLSIDKLVNNVLLSKEYIITKQNYFISAVVHALSFISFRTVLYLFYIAVLIVSRMSILEPNLIPSEFQSFVLSIEYCLILLVVFDKFFAYLLQDDERIRRIAGKFSSVKSFVIRKRKKKKG